MISTGKSGYPICSSKQLGAYSREMLDDCLVQSLTFAMGNSEARRFTRLHPTREIKLSENPE